MVYVSIKINRYGYSFIWGAFGVGVVDGTRISEAKMEEEIDSIEELSIVL